jgi:hypothetical protein
MLARYNHHNMFPATEFDPPEAVLVPKHVMTNVTKVQKKRMK